ncbi:AAA family ATPase [Methylomagnum sp.]
MDKTTKIIEEIKLLIATFGEILEPIFSLASSSNEGLSNEYIESVLNLFFKAFTARMLAGNEDIEYVCAIYNLIFNEEKTPDEMEQEISAGYFDEVIESLTKDGVLIFFIAAKKTISDEATCSKYCNGLCELLRRIAQYTFALVGVDSKDFMSNQNNLSFLSYAVFMGDQLIFLANDDDQDEVDSYDHKPDNSLGIKSFDNEQLDADDLVNAQGELNNLIGLANIKEEVRSLANYLRISQLRAGHALPIKSLSLHMVFSGNPGTGKTTVARLLARILKSLGILTKGHLIETDRAGLVAAYQGQTAQKVANVVKSALGGILFIDEAYSLTESDLTGDYGREAVDALLKLMEDHRDEFIVIVAGYPEKMARFIQSNPGLRSRFNRVLNFEDYAPNELYKIFQALCHDAGYKLTNTATSKIRKVVTDAYKSKDPYFGNAREIRNIFERTLINHANRLAQNGEFDAEELQTLKQEDIQLA